MNKLKEKMGVIIRQDADDYALVTVCVPNFAYRHALTITHPDHFPSANKEEIKDKIKDVLLSQIEDIEWVIK